jgi:hypothetical protein
MDPERPADLLLLGLWLWRPGLPSIPRLAQILEEGQKVGARGKRPEP